MADPLESFEFSPDGVAEVVAAMESLLGTRGWLTIDPGVREEHLPPTQSLFGRIVGNRGPWVPRSTWVPADMERRSPEPTSVGMLHAAGQKAVKQLEEKGIDVPERWRIVSDHPKRGLVAYVPIDIEHGDVVRWVVAASTALTKVPLTGGWRATVHRVV